MAHQNRDPRYCNFFLDANALDRHTDEEVDLVDRFHKIANQLGINPTMSFGVEAEIQHPNTPFSVKADMGGIYTIETALNPNEISRKMRIRDLRTGNAKSDKHIADADHLFEADKYGGGYFITHENRILRKRREISRALENELRIVKLSEFVEFCEIIKNRSSF